MTDGDKRDIGTLLAIMRRLRDPVAGCPWDREQDFGSIAPYTIEEAYEVADAIDRDDLADLRDELGDLLLQVVFHAQMARELGVFDFGDVVEAISEKMLRRHPHVFGDATVASAEAQRAAWENLKAEERRRASGQEASALDGVGLALPALVRAEKLGRRAARTGFDWSDPPGVIAKVREELQELESAIGAADRTAVEEELGDLLFTFANLARHLRVDSEEALRGANRKFERRFRVLEQQVRTTGRPWESFTPAELDALWEGVKRTEC